MDAPSPSLLEQSRAWKEADRRRDREALASGEVTAEELQARNALVANAAEWRITNLTEVLRRCYEDDTVDDGSD